MDAESPWGLLHFVSLTITPLATVPLSSLLFIRILLSHFAEKVVLKAKKIPVFLVALVSLLLPNLLLSIGYFLHCLRLCIVNALRILLCIVYLC